MAGLISKLRSRLRWAMAPKCFGAVPVTRSICLSIVRNEQDVIEPFLRHNARFFDAMVILDNRSHDRTRQILEATARDLGNVFVADLPDRGYNQSHTMTQALHFAQGAFFADFVAFLDADEFIASPSRAAFDRALDRIPVGSCAALDWQTYLPDPAGAADGQADCLARMTFRRKTEDPVVSKALLRLGGQVRPDLVVGQGNHSIYSKATGTLPNLPLLDLALMHFPVRSAAQMVVKGVLGWQAHLARDKPNMRENYQWKLIHDRFAASFTSIAAADLADLAISYAQSASPKTFAENALPGAHGIDLTRRHSDGQFADPKALLAAGQLPDPAPLSLPGPRNPPAPRSADTIRIENAFEDHWHWDLLFLDMAPIRHLIERHRPESLLDVGCGNGLYPWLAQTLGVSTVLGLDGIAPSATVLPDDSYQQIDLQEPFDIRRSFDLVICLEVLEHLLPEVTGALLDQICTHARGLIVFSMAEPGQPGNGHINCLPMAQLLEFWSDRGWQPDLIETLALRALSSMSWFRRNLLVLRPGTAESGQMARAALTRIGAMPYHWYPQSPGVRRVAFQEPYPPLHAAYGLRLT